MSPLDRLGVTVPLIQAPMAGVSTPAMAMAAAVSDAGALGSIAVGATSAAGARAMIAEVRARTDRPFNVNVFAHREPMSDPARDARWCEQLRPSFAAFGAEPPRALRSLYRSFGADPDLLAALVDTAPAVVSFHFGLPADDAVAALHANGSLLLATATSPAEARAAEDGGIDGIVAQGIEAGGHRGVFDPDAPDDALGTMALTRLLVRRSSIPVIAAGGIMDGAGIAAALALGAEAAQLGTAFIACPESAAEDAHKAGLTGPSGRHTVLSRLITGRPARALANRFTALAGTVDDRLLPEYPVVYDVGKALHAAARARGEYGHGAHWAGQGAPLARPLPAGELVAHLRAELAASRPRG